MNLESNTSWDLKTIYKRAFELTKRNRNLWILGLAVSLFVVSGSSYSDHSSSSKKSESPASYLSLLKESENATGAAAIKEVGYRFGATIGQSFKRVAPITYVVIGTEILLAIGLFSTIAIAASAWSRAALIHGCAAADSSGVVDLAESGRAGRDKIKAVISIDFLPWFKFWLWGFLALLTLLFLIVAKIVVLVVALTLGIVIAAIVVSIKITVAQIFAYRLAVLADQDYQTAMVQGKKISQGNLGTMFLLGLVNTLVSGSITIVLLSIIGGALLLSLFGIHPSMFTIPGIITFVFTLFIASPALKLKSALMHSFSYLTWHQTFKIFNHKQENI